MKIAIAAAILLASAPALAAEPDLKACVASYEDGQRLLHDNDLRRARERLLVCGRAPCPREMWPDCMRWLNDVEQRMPSLVVGAHDSDGHDLTDVRVTVDGKLLEERLDARAVEIDPGEHVIVFQRNDETIEQKILIAEGEKRRLVRVQFRRPKAPPPDSPPPTGGPPTAALIAGGIGVAALGAFAFFGLSGRADYMDLERTCSPHCSSSDTAPARTKLLVADVSLGVSIVAFAAATYFFLRRPSAAPPPAQKAIGLGVDVARTGAFATAHVAF